MNIKRIISLFITVLLVVGTITTVSAASFPDLEARHSWAREAVDNMVSRGILKGYTDGTFKPDRPVTHLETLIIASRIMGVDNDENVEYRKAAIKQYEPVLAAYDIDYNAEISYLMYTGVLTADELPNYISEKAKNEPLKRYEAAIILTKLVGAEKEALSSTIVVLDFADAGSIPASASAYVKYVADSGLMNGVDDKNFSPSGELTRAMISTVMYRAEKLMDTNVVEGTIESKTEQTVTLTVKGISKNIEIPEGVAIKADGKKVGIKDLAIGQYIRVHYQGNDIRYIDAATSNLYQTITGTIASISEVSGSRNVAIKNSTGTQSFVINPDGCEYKIDNKISTYGDIKIGQYATFNIKGGYITSIAVELSSKKVSGTIDSIAVTNDAVIISITQKDGTKAEFILNEDASIIRNNSTADVRSLAEGDSVTITILNGGIDYINATSSTKSVTGTISKIEISANSAITVKTANDEGVYSVTADTKFSVDGKSDCTIYDLRLGASAVIRLDSTNIKTIETQSLVVTPTMTGVITYIHPTGYAMGLRVVDPATGNANEVQTVVKSTVKITDTTSSRITTFKALQPGMTVVVVGTSNYGVYEVNQIIVTP